MSGPNGAPEPAFRVVVTTFFGEKEVARYPTLEQAEHRAAELNEHAERNPRGYVAYSVRKAGERSRFSRRSGRGPWWFRRMR